jgi:NitT/TauT family transport system substrate-binding protein
MGARIGIALLAAAFGAFFAASPARADDAVVEVTGSGPTSFYAVLGDVAEYAGFYREQHLTVTVQVAGSPYVAAQVVASGKGDVCSTALEPLVSGYDKGVHLQSFFSRDPHYQFVLAVPADSPIASLADFKGATIGEYSIGSPAELGANSELTGAGLRKSDVSYVPIGSGAQAINAMNTGKVAAAAFPYLELALYEVNANQRYRFFWHPILKDIGDLSYAATPATIQAKGDILRRFARANVEAAILIRENPQLAAQYFLRGAGIQPTADRLANQVRLLLLAPDQLPGFDPSSKRIGYQSPLGVGVLTKFLYESGATSEVVPASAVLTNQFIASANDFDHEAFIARVKHLH